MAEFSFVEHLNRLVRNPNFKFTNVNQLSGAALTDGMDGFWGFIAAASSDIGETAYRGVKNFSKNMGNPDCATIESLLSMSSMIGYEPILGRPGVTTPANLSRLFDTLSVTRYVFNATLPNEIVIIVPDSEYSSVFGATTPTPYIGTHGVDAILYFLFDSLTVSEKIALATYEETTVLDRMTWQYVEGITADVVTASGNASWPFETAPSSTSFEYKFVFNSALDRAYVSNIGTLPWKEYLTYRFYDYFMTYFDFQMSGTSYVDPVMEGYFNGTKTVPTFDSVVAYANTNSLTYEQIENTTWQLNRGELDWKTISSKLAGGCRLFLESCLSEMLETTNIGCSYIEFRMMGDLETICYELGWKKYEDTNTVVLFSECPDETPTQDFPITKLMLIKATAQSLANSMMAFHADRALIKHQAASYIWGGTDALMETAISDFITTQMTDESYLGIDMPNKFQRSGASSGYIFDGKINIVKYLDTIDYYNVAQLNELSITGRPLKNNETTTYNREYFASVLGYPYSAGQTDTNWNAVVPASIKTQVDALLATVTLQSRYWEDSSALWPTIPWKQIVDFYRNIGLAEKDYTGYAPYSTDANGEYTNAGTIIETGTVQISGVDYIKPLRLLAPSVINMGVSIFPEGEEADRGIFYYIMWLHQLGAAQGKADIDSLNSTLIPTWNYYKAYSAAKQTPNWFLNLENVNHVSFKPISYLAAISKKVVERFSSEVVQLMSFATDYDLTMYLQTAVDNTGMTIDSWRKENVDWTTYNTFHEMADATAPDGTQSKWMGMDGPWSLKFMKEYIDDNASLWTDNSAKFKEWFAHLNLAPATITALATYYGQPSGATYASFSALENVKIKSYAKDSTGLSFTLFDDGSLVVRPKGWPIGAFIADAICDEYVLDTTQLSGTGFLTDITVMQQSFADTLVFEHTINTNKHISVMKIEQLGEIRSIFKAKGNSDFEVTTPVVNLAGQWIGVFDNMVQSSGSITADYYWYDVSTGRSNKGSDSVSVSISMNEDTDLTNGFVCGSYGTNFVIGSASNAGGWAITLIDTTDTIGSIGNYTWDQLSGFDPAEVTGMFTTGTSSGLIGQMLETQISGIPTKWVLPMNTPSSTEIIPFDDLDLTYGERMKSYKSENIILAARDGIIKGIYPTLENDMFGFTETTLNSLAVQYSGHTFGEVTDFAYDGIQSFIAYITSDTAGSGELTQSSLNPSSM